MHYFLKSILIALQNIRANPLHTFLSTLGIIIGVASLVGILTLADGLEQSGRQQLSDTTSLNILNVSSKNWKTINDVRVPVEDRPRLTLEHVLEVEEMYADRAVVEFVSRTTKQAAYGDSLTGTYLQGNMQNGLSFAPDSIFSGRYISKEDVSGNANIAVLTYALASKWNEDVAVLIGGTFQVFGKEFEIVGVFKQKENDSPRIYIPISTYLENEDTYASITMKVEAAEDIPIIEEELEIWLDSKFEQGKEAFQLVSNKFRIEQFSQGILVFKLVMGAITGISVLVGGIGVMNVLLISVTERTKEIGVRKATGAKKKDIVLQFMAESVTISFVGCILGWLLGVIGLMIFVPIVNSVANFGFIIAINFWTVLTILVIALLIGVVFGTYPAWRASQLDPIDAIRHE
ncbi:MAG: ABC transporter permease [Balneolaceae bacterium]